MDGVNILGMPGTEIDGLDQEASMLLKMTSFKNQVDIFKYVRNKTTYLIVASLTRFANSSLKSTATPRIFLPAFIGQESKNCRSGLHMSDQ